jgi:hypothetical protein
MFSIQTILGGETSQKRKMNFFEEWVVTQVTKRDYFFIKKICEIFLKCWLSTFFNLRQGHYFYTRTEKIYIHNQF